MLGTRDTKVDSNREGSNPVIIPSTEGGRSLRKCRNWTLSARSSTLVNAPITATGMDQNIVKARMKPIATIALTMRCHEFIPRFFHMMLEGTTAMQLGTICKGAGGVIWNAAWAAVSVSNSMNTAGSRATSP